MTPYAHDRQRAKLRPMITEKMLAALEGDFLAHFTDDELQSLYNRAGVDASDVKARFSIVTRALNKMSVRGDGPIFHVGKFNAEIARLEDALEAAGRSVTRSPKLWKASLANRRIEELRADLATIKAQQAKPKTERVQIPDSRGGTRYRERAVLPTYTPTSAAAVSAPAAKQEPTLQEIYFHVFGESDSSALAQNLGGNDKEIDARIERNLWCFGLTWPGMDVAELTRLHGPAPEQRGLARITRADRQRKLDALYSTQNKKGN